MRKKATGQLGRSAMTGKPSLKAEVADQSSKSKIPWTQPVTAQNVKTRTSKVKATEDNAKWANRAMQDAEKAMDKAAETKDTIAYRKAVEQYKKASEAYAESTAKVIQNENAMQAQADYVRRHASEDQGDALRKENEDLSRLATLKGYGGQVFTEEEQKQIDAAAKNFDAKSKRLQELANVSDHYANPTSKITDMSDQAFQQTYDSYDRMKSQSENYEEQAKAYRAMADKYIKSDPAKYQDYMDKAESYQAMADSNRAKMNEITGGDDKVAYALESRGKVTQMATAAAKDKNFEKYAKIGAAKDWKPKLQNAYESMLNQIGFLQHSSDDLINQMTDEQKATLYYYLGRGDEDKAQEYFSALEPTLASKRMSAARESMADYVEDHPVIGTAANAFVSTASVPLRLESVAENAVRAGQNKLSGTYQPYATNTLMDAPAVMNEGTQLGLSQNLQNTFGISEGKANFLAGTIVSMANNAMQFGGAGGGANVFGAGIRNALAQKGGSAAAKVAAQQALEQAAKNINEWLPLALMSTNAGADTIREQLESGSDFGKALLYGGLCGAVEWWTEKIGVDSWVELATGGLKSGILKGLWKSAGKIDRTKLQNLVKSVIGLGNQALSEGGEEVISNVVDTILDVAINGEDSEFMQYRNQLIAEGYSTAEAERKATIQFYVKNSAESFAGGAISGLAFGAINIPANLQSDAHIGQAIIDNGTDLDLVNAGLEYGKDTDVYKQAAKIAEKLDSRESYQPTAAEITRLSVAMDKESKSSPAATITERQVKDGGGSQLSTFATELQATGAISGKDAIAANAALSKAIDGEMLTAADIKSLHAEIPAVRDVLSQKLGTQLKTGSSDEVRSAITQYVKNGNSAKTQAAGQAKARDIIKDAIPYAKKAVNEETGAEVAGVRLDAENAVDAQSAAAGAAIDQAAVSQAVEATNRISKDADQQAADQKAKASRDKRGNLNYKEFSEQYRQSHPQAGNTEITEAYDHWRQSHHCRSHCCRGRRG